MISFRSLYLVIACMLLEHAPLHQTLSFQAAGLFLLAIATVFLTLCMLFGVGSLRSRPRRDLAGKLQRLSRCRRAFETVWTILYPPLLAAIGWHAWAFSHDAEVSVSMESVVMLFGPHVLVMVALEVLMAAIVADVSAADPAAAETAALTWGEAFQLGIRQGGLLSLAMCLMPMLFLLGMQQSYSSLNEIMPWEATVLVVVVLGVALLAFVPTLVGWFLGARNLDDSKIRQRVEHLLVASRCQRLQVKLIDGPGWATAAVVGWLPWGQQLWLGRALVDQLSDEELDLVVLHEVAHVRKWHFAYRLLPAAWAIGLSMFFVWSTEELWSDVGLAGVESALAIMASVMAFLVGLIVVSRACELEADREACELARHHCLWAQGKIGEPNARLATALCGLLGHDARTSRGSWLHPSLEDRLRNLAEDLNQQKRRLAEHAVAG